MRMLARPGISHSNSPSSAVRVSSSTSHFFRMAKIVLEANPARINWRKTRAASFLALWFLQPLAVQVVAGLLLFVDFVVDRIYRLVDDFAVHSLGFQVGDHAPAAKLLIVAAEGRKRGGVFGVVQVTLVFQDGE